MLLVSFLASQVCLQKVDLARKYTNSSEIGLWSILFVHPRVNCGRKKSPNWNVNDFDIFDQKGQLHQQITATTMNKQVTTDPR
jgi:hypothetical protein